MTESQVEMVINPSSSGLNWNQTSEWTPPSEVPGQVLVGISSRLLVASEVSIELVPMNASMAPVHSSLGACASIPELSTHMTRKIQRICMANHLPVVIDCTLTP